MLSAGRWAAVPYLQDTSILDDHGGPGFGVRINAVYDVAVGQYQTQVDNFLSVNSAISWTGT